MERCTLVGLAIVGLLFLTEVASGFQPEKFGQSATEAGSFETWRFPLQFNKYVVYLRRFGVDVPAECAVGQPSAPCPVLVDFHGSGDSLFSQRAWTKWHKYLTQVRNKFILLTPEGSPDALYKESDILNDCNDTSDDCIGSSATSWNVLGWGNMAVPLNRSSVCGSQDPKAKSFSYCFKSTLDPNRSYQCFGTHLLKEPKACQLTRDPDAPGYQIPTLCMSASGANDADYIESVLQFVVDHYQADPARIYFSGQSMGGMASLQFAAFQADRPLDSRVRPAAIAPCSAGASRSSAVQLQGKMPTLLLWGYTDFVAPPTLWAGCNRDNKNLTHTAEFSSLLRNSTLRRLALQVVGGSPHEMCDQRVCSSMECCLLLQANAMTGGKLLQETSVQQTYDHAGHLGCENNIGELTSLDSSGFMWEGVLTTLQGVVGHAVDMSSLSWKAPEKLPQAAQEAIDFLCATVPAETTVKVCIFNGGHSLPWNAGPSDLGHDWMQVSGDDGVVFHDFIWEDFLQGGTIKRDDPNYIVT